MNIRCILITREISKTICILPTINIIPKSDFYGNNPNAFSIAFGFIIWKILIIIYNEN